MREERVGLEGEFVCEGVGTVYLVWRFFIVVRGYRAGVWEQEQYPKLRT